MATIYDAQQKISEALQNEIHNVGQGVCADNERTADWHAMQYRHRIGVVEGLKLALTIIEGLERAG